MNSVLNSNYLKLVLLYNYTKEYINKCNKITTVTLYQYGQCSIILIFNTKSDLIRYGFTGILPIDLRLHQGRRSQGVAYILPWTTRDIYKTFEIYSVNELFMNIVHNKDILFWKKAFPRASDLTLQKLLESELLMKITTRLRR